MKTLLMLLIASTILLSHASFANDKQEEGKKNVKEYAEAQHGKQGMGKQMHGENARCRQTWKRKQALFIVW